jgi:hypothetical protein
VAPLWFEFSPLHIILIETRFHQYFMVQRALGAPTPARLIPLAQNYDGTVEISTAVS